MGSNCVSSDGKALRSSALLGYVISEEVRLKPDAEGRVVELAGIADVK